MDDPNERERIYRLCDIAAVVPVLYTVLWFTCRHIVSDQQWLTFFKNLMLLNVLLNAVAIIWIALRYGETLHKKFPFIFGRWSTILFGIVAFILSYLHNNFWI